MPFFDKVDRNSDGKVTQDELPRGRQFQGSIQKFDEDEDGALQYEEFLKLMESLDTQSEERGRGGAPAPPAQPSV